MDDMAYVRKVSRCTSKRSRKDVFCFEFSSAIDGCLEEERAILEVGVFKSLSSRVTMDEVRVRSGRICLGARKGGIGGLALISNLTLGCCMRTTQHSPWL